MKLKLILAMLALTSIVGCTSIQTVNPATTNLAEQLEAGENLVVYERAGRVIKMTLVSIQGETLNGTLTDSPETAVAVNFADIYQLKVERIDKRKTTIAVLGLLVGIPPGTFTAPPGGPGPGLAR